MVLSVEMARQSFYGMHDAKLTQAWLEDLVSIGYEIPSINPTPNPCRKVVSEVSELHPKEYPSSDLHVGKELRNFI